MAKNDVNSSKKCMRTTVSIPTDDYVELERIAMKRKVSVAWVVREAVDRFLSDESPLFRMRREEQ
jgi:hypothetical protein